MALLRDLRNLGADSVFDLPKIAVIGSQSAGKSSLIEAVTGINVPRDSGTCTRCPMECTMSSTAPSGWMCSISLRSGAPGQFSQATRFGPDIRRKDEVELWLRRAQGAILSTDPNKTQWHDQSADQIKQAIAAGTGMRMFSEDTIVVDIQDQGLTDLSFVDLPGLIQNAEQKSIDLIRNLSTHYIQSENALILIAMPAIDDIQNQGAFKLGKEADPNGRRTIGVLTKPDLLGSGSTGLHDILRQTMQNLPGSRDHLQHGYYCVRLPDDAKRREGYTAQNLPNPDFFDKTPPWCDIRDRGRFGIKSLVQNISVLLAQLIEANLPRLRERVETELRSCINSLSQLPPIYQVDNPMTSILRMINEFLGEIDRASVGDMHKSLAQACRKRYTGLRGDISATCPQFRPRRAGDGDNVYDIAAVSQLIEDCTGWELPKFTPYEVITTLIQRFLQGWKSPTEACFEDIYSEFSSFIDRLADNHFGNYRNLKQFVSTHTQAELKKIKVESEKAVHKLLSIEENMPFFSQRTDFENDQDKRMREYHSIFHLYLNYNENREELYVMATVRTYFQYAYERFSDSMLRMVEHDLVQPLKNRLEVTLLDNVMQLRHRGGEGHLVAEDPNIGRWNNSQCLDDIRNTIATLLKLQIYACTVL
ncbi:Interferon-induced GTP-binding protein Mx1 [Leucoagaricus sp. SymC.cos]|nr:Interferon-induced GTP-binding protein Mx1 [Leucoagaricus sp. SymC.cos]